MIFFSLGRRFEKYESAELFSRRPKQQKRFWCLRFLAERAATSSRQVVVAIREHHLPCDGCCLRKLEWSHR